MATSSSCIDDSLNSGTQNVQDPIKALYEAVIEDETPLPRCWSSKDKYNFIGLSQNNLRVHYKGVGKSHKDAASVRATHPIPPACGLYYYEVKIVSKGRDGYMGIGLSIQGVNMNRLPGWDKNSYGYHGDDGHSFCSSGTGLPYGPTFTTGDVIGCGINLIDNVCFYTKNGHYLGVAFKDLPPNLYPTVGLQTPGEVIDANFGQAPFVFDIKEMTRELQSRERATIKNFPVTDTYCQWKSILQKMVFSYLTHHGYSATAETFGRSTSQELEEEIASIRNRQKIQGLVLAGKLGETIRLVKELYPGLLEKNSNLLFMLRVRQFIEMVNGTDSEVESVSGNKFLSHETSLSHCDAFSHSQRSRSPTPPPSPSESSCWTNGKITESSKTVQHTSVIQSTKNIMSSMNHSSSTLSTEELNQRNVQDPSNTSVIHSNSSSTSTANGTTPIISPPPPDPIINPLSSNSPTPSSSSNSVSTSSATSSTSHINDSDVEMDYVEAGSSNCPREIPVGHSNGFTNGFGKHSDQHLDLEEDMDVEGNQSRMMCRGNPAAIERMLFLGRELQQMSQNLRRELGKNKQNKTMLQDAFSLLAYNDPWNSPVGWQLDPIQRESVCQALNSAILESFQCPSKSPLEISITHTKQLLDLMSRSGIGSCAFASVEAILHRNQSSNICPNSISNNSNSHISCSSSSSNSSSSSSSNHNGVCPEPPVTNSHSSQDAQQPPPLQQEERQTSQQ